MDGGFWFKKYMPTGVYKRTEETKRKMSLSKKGKLSNAKSKHWKLSEERKKQLSKTNKGDKNGRWKGDDANYHSMHTYLGRNFGKANKCKNRENKCLNFECNRKSNKFHWANMKNHNYSHKIEDYMMLCASCHKKFDSHY